MADSFPIRPNYRASRRPCYTNRVRALSPKYAVAFNNRGNALCAKKEYGKAIRDYDEAIRLDGKYVAGFCNRGWAWSQLKEYDNSIRDYDEALRHDPRNADAVICGYFARGWKGDAGGARFLNDSVRNLNDAWPYPVIRYLREEIDESALLKLADDDDGRRAGARFYLGLDRAVKGHKDDAMAQFRWIKEHAPVNFFAYPLALAELERLERGEK